MFSTALKPVQGRSASGFNVDSDPTQCARCEPDAQSFSLGCVWQSLVCLSHKAWLFLGGKSSVSPSAVGEQLKQMVTSSNPELTKAMSSVGGIDAQAG